jgi:hypothetical protein
LCGLTLALIACALVLAVPNRFPFSELYFIMTEISAALVGGLIASRQPQNPVGWFIIGHALCFTLGEFGRQYAIYGVLTNPGSLPVAGAVASLAYWVWYPGLMLMIGFLPLYFPDGRLVSPRWRPVAALTFIVAVILTAIAAIRPGDYETRGIPNPLGVESLNHLGFLSGILEVILPALWVSVSLLAVGSLVVRFWRSREVERQQMKWFVYAAVLFISLTVLEQVLGTLIPDTVDEISFVIALQAIWVAIGFAVLNYRLYDVDLVVNRTLVYTILTAALGIVYFGGVAALQLVTRQIPGDQSQLVIVISTLAIAALFNPLRHRTQSLIDRRFYRRKYDAAKTLEAFSARLRNDRDLQQLNAELLSVVRETMEPAHTSLWLRPPDGPPAEGQKT